MNLIVLGTHHKRGLARLGSVASVTLRYSHSAVAVVPVPEGELLAPDEVPCVRRVLVPTNLSPVSNHAAPFGARAIYEAAERLGADVICMGSHGRSGFQRAIVGSVAETVMRESRLPVFVVRPLPP